MCYALIQAQEMFEKLIALSAHVSIMRAAEKNKWKSNLLAEKHRPKKQSVVKFYDQQKVQIEQCCGMSTRIDNTSVSAVFRSNIIMISQSYESCT